MYKDLFDAQAAFGGFVLIFAIAAMVLWVSWVVFDFMSPLIKSLIMPILKMAQCEYNNRQYMIYTNEIYYECLNHR